MFDFLRLPGGSSTTYDKVRAFCMLDVILHESSLTIYVIDLIIWNGVSAVNWDASLRSYILLFIPNLLSNRF
jgi:hypothetical protein